MDSTSRGSRRQTAAQENRFCALCRWLRCAIGHFTALGARQVASEGLPADVDVRLFGEAGEGLPDSSEEDGYRARIAESSVAEMAVDAPKCSICPLVKWGMLRLRAYKVDFAN